MNKTRQLRLAGAGSPRRARRADEVGRVQGAGTETLEPIVSAVQVERAPIARAQPQVVVALGRSGWPQGQTGPAPSRRKSSRGARLVHAHVIQSPSPR